jgi:hypothetical protein
MMRGKYVFSCLTGLVILFCLVPVFAQDESGDIFAPFVSRLTAAGEGTKVVISWKNAEDVSGSKQIYRALAEITETTVKNAILIARVAPEAESYIDTPPAGGTYFYAVIIEDAKGDAYRVFIPFRNKTATGIRIEAAAAAKDQPAVVTDLAATAAADSISIRFLPSEKTRELILFRSTSPILTPADLARAAYSIILSPGTTQRTDTPLAGINYYYAVVDAALVNSGRAVLTPGQNTTASPVAMTLREPLSRTDIARSRKYPLPAPHILYAVESGDELLPPLPFLLPPQMSLSAPVAERVDTAIERLRRPDAQPAFTLLVHEQAPNLEGEDQALSAIALAAASATDQKDTVARLSDFLSVPHSVTATTRARFYLGQAHFLRGEYREALVELIFARSSFYVETQVWIDASLERLDSAR